MLQFLCLLMLLCYPNIIESQDIELEGLLRVGNSFLNQLKHNLLVKTKSDEIHGSDEEHKTSSKSRKNLEPSENAVSMESDTTNDDRNSNSDRSTGDSEELDNIVLQIVSEKTTTKDGEKFSNTKDSVSKIAKHKKYNTIKNKATTSSRTYLKKDHPLVKKFIDHIIFDEAEGIDRIAERIAETVALNKTDIAPMLNNARASYIAKMEGYVAYINKKPITCDVDREYLYLDVVASSNMLLYSEARKLLNSMIEKSSGNVSVYDLETLTQAIYEEHVHQKKRAIFFICHQLNICRSYPGFSDFFAELISEVLKLSDSSLGYVVKAVTKLIKDRDNFFKAFVKDDIAEMIGARLEMMSKDLFNFREMLSIIRSIISQRFKLMKTNDEQLRIRTKAVRLFIDLVDKTFSLAGGSDLTSMTFDTTVKGIRHWALGKRDEVDIPLRLLLEHIVGVINSNWNEYVTQEVKMLTEVIMTGKTDMTDIYDELFARGSPFVRFDIVQSD